MRLKNDHWIGAADESWQSPVFTGSFTAGALQTAVIEICGLGFFELYVNGARVGEDYFVPAFSNYAPRARESWVYPITDDMRCRTYVMTYELTPYLREGENELCVMLGDGWFRQEQRLVEGNFSFGSPRLTFCLELTAPDGSTRQIVSGDWLRCCPGYITQTNLYLGERQDLRRLPRAFAEAMAPALGAGIQSRAENTPDETFPVRPLPPLETVLEEQQCPTDRVERTLTPQLVLDDGKRRVYDNGENITGFVAVCTHGKPGEEITLRHSEELTPQGDELDFDTPGGAGQIQTASYVCDGTSRLCHPHFCWQAFRYFEITGPGEPHHVEVVHADVAVTTEFACSNATLNWLFDAFVRTQLANMHCGVPSDCPHRERLGYTGDGQLAAPAALLTLDYEPFLRKWMQDIADGQGENGHVQHTAPCNGGGGGPGAWGGAIYLVPLACYLHTGKTDIAGQYLPNVLRWLEYMHSRSEGGLVVREEPGGWCLGDWCLPQDAAPLPEPFVNTYYYIKGIDAALLFEQVTGMAIPERDVLCERRRLSLRAMTDAYFDPDTGSFCGGADGADAFALDLSLGDGRLLQNLVSKYEALGALDTGICGTPVLLGVLFSHGYAELAVRLMTSANGPSFEGMRRAGATTLWEYWEGKKSHSHPMFGACARYLLEYILGVRQSEGAAGYESPIVQPADIPGIDWARGSILTPRGRIRVAWERDAAGKIQVHTCLQCKDSNGQSFQSIS